MPDRNRFYFLMLIFPHSSPPPHFPLELPLVSLEICFCFFLLHSFPSTFHCCLPFHLFPLGSLSGLLSGLLSCGLLWHLVWALISFIVLSVSTCFFSSIFLQFVNISYFPLSILLIIDIPSY